MKSKKPLAPWLPHPYGRMTREEFEAESTQYDAEFAGTQAPHVANRRPHPVKRGRPHKPAGQKVARVLITMAPQLLAATDAAADKQGLTRASLIRRAVLDWLARRHRPGRSA